MDKDVTDLTLREVGDLLAKSRSAHLERTAGRVYLVQEDGRE